MSPPKTKRTRQLTNTPNFRKLQKEWYEKLKKSGFEDIEHFKNGDMVPKILSPKDAVRMGVSMEQIEDGFEYYRSAGIFLHEYKFASEFDRKFWEMHASGSFIIEIKLNREINLELKRIGGPHPEYVVMKRLKKEFLEWVRETNKDGASK